MPISLNSLVVARFHKIVVACIAISTYFYPVISQPDLLWESYQPTFHTSPANYNLLRSKSPSFKLDNAEKIVVSSRERIENEVETPTLFKYEGDGQVRWKYVSQNIEGLSKIMSNFDIDVQNNIIHTGEIHTKFVFDYDQSYGESELYVEKLSPDGDLIWTYHRPGPEFSYCTGKTISIDELNNVYISGTIFTREREDLTVIIKLDTEGNLIWETLIPGVRILNAKIIDQTIRVVASSEKGTVFQSYDLNGQKIYNRELLTIRTSVAPFIDDEGNFFVFSSDFKVTKFNSLGHYLWEFREPKKLPQNVSGDAIQSITLDSMSNLYITGKHYGEHYGIDSLYKNADMLTIKLSKDGNEIWRNRYEHDGKNTAEVGAHMCLLPNEFLLASGYRTTGSLHTDGVLNIIDTLGRTIWLRTEDEGLAKDEYIIQALVDNKHLYTMGWFQNDSNKIDLSLKKFELNKIIVATEELHDSRQLVIFPNPASSSFEIIINDNNLAFDMQVFNMSGKLMFFEENTLNRQFSIPDHIISGSYHIMVSQGNMKYSSMVFINR